MHTDEFSTIRNTLLGLNGAILQDDSGIPVRYFDSKRWKLQLHGSYAPPLDIFREYDQPDLAELYKRTSDGRPLEFGAGYHWNPKQANLMLAVPK
jgi:hypothetical protein